MNNATYRVMGWGKRVGAIGVSSFFVIDLQCANEEEAKIKVYEYYEHISSMQVKRINHKEQWNTLINNKE